jgi:hypothetical protein
MNHESLGMETLQYKHGSYVYIEVQPKKKVGHNIVVGIFITLLNKCSCKSIQ